jgi:hypothetical protein
VIYEKAIIIIVEGLKLRAKHQRRVLLGNAKNTHAKRLLSVPFVVAFFLSAAYIVVSTSMFGFSTAGGTTEKSTPQTPPLFIRLTAATFDPLQGTPNSLAGPEISSYPAGENSYFIVQFTGPVMAEWKEKLEERGAVLYWYIPDYAFLVRMDTSIMTKIQSLPFVRWIGFYQPAYKINPDLLGTGSAESVTIDILTSDIDTNPVASEVSTLGGKVLGAASGMIKAQVMASDITKLATINDVVWIEPWYPRIAFNDTARWVIQSGVSGYTPIHDNGIHGENQLVTIADTGLRVDNENLPSHEMFVDPGKAAGPGNRKVQAYYVPPGAGGALGDEVGHGTHVAGSVAGDAGTWYVYDNAPGSTGKHDGQAFAARIVMQDIDNSSDIYVYPPDDYTNLFQPAYDVGSLIHTNSWGSENDSGDLSWYDISAQIVDNFMWQHKDFQVLFAMANSGPSPNSLSFEAQAKDAISVGATLNGTSADSVASFSSRGYADDNRIKPTIVAPGVGIWSASYSADNLYIQLSGTSMATPTTAGALALIQQYYSEGWYPTGEKNPVNAFEPSSALVRATLINGAVEISGSGAYYNGAKYPNGDQGWGRIDLNNSLYFKGDSKRMWLVDNVQGVSTGENSRYQIHVSDNTQPLKFTLAWTDYPGSPNVSVQLVNDLNLKITDPNGKVYLGNVFTSYDPGYSTIGGAPDNRNVEEAVLLLPDNDKFPTGTYTVDVEGYNVPDGEAGTNAQPFALVVTGGISDAQPIIIPAQSWTQTNWEGGPAKPVLQIGTWNRPYFGFYDNENVSWSLPGKIRLASSGSLFKSAGWLESSVYDAGDNADWKKVSWAENKPGGTSIVVKVRTGNDNNPYDGGWSGWYQQGNGSENTLMPDGRYVQYRVELSTTNITRTPELSEITLDYEVVAENTPPRSVELSVSPSYQSGWNSSLAYTLTIKNTGSLDDIYELSARDNENWGLLVTPSEVYVTTGGTEFASLNVTIPTGAAPGAEDNVVVSAISINDNTVSADNTCIAQAVAPSMGTASIRLATSGTSPYLWGIRKVDVTANILVSEGDNLRLRFLAYDNLTVESEAVIWSRTAPGAENVNFMNLVVLHDADLPYPLEDVKRVKLVLTDNLGNVILDNMSWYTVVQDDWSNRISWIILNWGSHTSPQQDQLSDEINHIVLDWALVPETRNQHDFSL